MRPLLWLRGFSSKKQVKETALKRLEVQQWISNMWVLPQRAPSCSDLFWVKEIR